MLCSFPSSLARGRVWSRRVGRRGTGALFPRLFQRHLEETQSLKIGRGRERWEEEEKKKRKRATRKRENEQQKKRENLFLFFFLSIAWDCVCVEKVFVCIKEWDYHSLLSFWCG